MFEPLSWLNVPALVSATKSAGPATIFLVCGALLFTPGWLAAMTGIDTVRTSYRIVVGVAFYGAGAILVVQVAAALWKKWCSRWRLWQRHRQTVRALENLSDEEKLFLRRYLDEKTATQYAPIYDGVANGLARQQILFLPANLTIPGQPGLLTPFNLTPEVRGILARRPGLIG